MNLRPARPGRLGQRAGARPAGAGSSRPSRCGYRKRYASVLSKRSLKSWSMSEPPLIERVERHADHVVGHFHRATSVADRVVAGAEVVDAVRLGDPEVRQSDGGAGAIEHDQRQLHHPVGARSAEPSADAAPSRPHATGCPGSPTAPGSGGRRPGRAIADSRRRNRARVRPRCHAKCRSAGRSGGRGTPPSAAAGPDRACRAVLSGRRAPCSSG